MGSTTIPGGGNTDHHGFHVYGTGLDMGHHGPVGVGFVGHGPRSFGTDGWGTSHGHVGNSYGGPMGGHNAKGHGSDHPQGERFGGHTLSGFGHDTISMGSGHDTLVDAGRAAGAHFGYHVSSHSATMAGGAHHASFIGGGHSLMAHGGAGSVAGGTSHVTALFADHKVGTDVIKTFVTGHDKLHLEGQALSYLHSHVDVTVSHGATTLKLDGGHTTIALKGFSHIDSMGHK